MLLLSGQDILKIFVTMIVIIFLLSGVSSAFSMNNEISGLKQVHLLYRHGDRTPCDIYPTDPYKDPSNWPVGFGQLTSEGKRMHFNLGQWLRQRYDGFLSYNYSEEEIYVRSTDKDRTLMSAQSNLAGLYPPSGYWEWDSDLAWQPIPVHTLPMEMDKLLFNHHTECPRLDEKKKQLKSSSYMKSIYDDNKDLFDYISAHSGWSVKTVEKLDFIYDSLLVETKNNKTLPEWTKSIFPGGRFEKLRNIAFLTDTFDQEMKRLQGGPFMHELVTHYDAATATDNTREVSEKKVFMYSAHDTTISYVLNTLGVYNGLAPPYASLVMFELMDKDGWKVKISYRNDTTKVPYVLTIPGCQQLCPLNLFKQLTESVRPRDWSEECQVGQMDGIRSMLSMERMDATTLLMVVWLVFCMVVAILLVLALVVCWGWKNRAGRRGLYMRL